MSDRVSQAGQTCTLTPAQREALRVLAAANCEVDGWKQRSRSEPTPMVNYLAAGSLVRMGLASCRLPREAHWLAHSHDYLYEITDAGREVSG